MAAFNTTRTNYGIESVAGRIGAYIASAYAEFRAWQDARATRNALSGLTDRELEDIGLVRGDIDLVAEARRRF